MISGLHKQKRPKGRELDCWECPKVPESTRTELMQIGLKFGPERSMDTETARRFLLYYHEVQAGAPFPSCSFQSRLFGMIHYMLHYEMQDAIRQTSQTPGLMMAFLEATR